MAETLARKSARTLARTLASAAILAAMGLSGMSTAGAAVDPRDDVLAFGTAPFAGSTASLSQVVRPVVALGAGSGGRGYWEVTHDGGVYTFGEARFFGSMGGRPIGRPVVDLAVHPGGEGYWLVAADGGVFSFGAARFHGSMGGRPLGRPIVAMASTPSGNGYWLVAADGGVFSFGDARFHGSKGGARLNAPVVGMAATTTGGGYWLVSGDGGIFSFGDAPFLGSMGGRPLSQPIVDMAADPDGRGYWMAGADGGVFSFQALFHGSAGGAELGDKRVTGIAASPAGGGYWLVLGPVPSVNDRPYWLGTRPLPRRPDGFGQVAPTPSELVDRRFAPPPGTFPPPPDGRFAATVATVPPDVAARSTWTAACPVPLADLRHVTVSYWGFDQRAHTGELLAHRSFADQLVTVFRRLFDVRYPIEEMRVIRPDELTAPPTGDGNVTTAFVCRPVTGGASWSEHARGLAVDVNPFHNPYRRGDLLIPELASAYVDRGRPVPGIIRGGDEVTRAFGAIGWHWGGDWQLLEDWMHFSASGR